MRTALGEGAPPCGPQATARLRLTKTGPCRFMSHLDFMRAVERAARRADIPVALTRGFHPHPRMSFGPAVPVGVESECELVDVDLRESLGAAEITRRLERVLPSGIQLVRCRVLPPGGPSLSSMITAASYQVDFDRDDIAGGPGVLDSAIGGILHADAIPFSRTTPKGTREFDLRPLIYDLRLLSGDGPRLRVQMMLATGSRGHARPDDVARAIAEWAGLAPEVRPSRIARKELYVAWDGGLRPLA